MSKKSFLAKFGSDSSLISLKTASVTIQNQPMPEKLVFDYHGYGSEKFSRALKVGSEIEKGTPLAKVGEDSVQPCPVKGTVFNIKHIPNLRGGEPLSAVFLKPSEQQEEQASFFEPLDWRKESVETLLTRVKDAGIMNTTPEIQLLSTLLAEAGERPIILVATDFEPELMAAMSLLRERKAELVGMVGFIEKISQTSNMPIAALDGLVKELQVSALNWLSIPEQYPENLPMKIAQRSGLKNPLFITLETAFAAWDAVGLGVLQEKKLVSILNSDGTHKALYRFHIGTQLEDAMHTAGFKAEDGDTIIIGGSYRGTAQYSLDGAINAGVDAMMHIKKEDLLPWSQDPCVSCGSCNDVCPVNLQVSLLTRYCEFGLYEEARQLDLDACIECGLCATECTVRRPLLQMILLGKNGQLEKAKLQELKHEAAPAEQKPGMFKDPAVALYANPTRFRVGAAPFKRAKTSLSQMNYTALFLLLPVVLVSAIAFMSDEYTINQGTNFGAIPWLLNLFLGEMGVGPNVLMLIGVLGVAALGMGTGVLVEYLTQVLMKQRYEATNGHGALVGLLVAFLMPPTISPFILMLAVALAIFIGKQIFGGIGSYPIHPAIVGWLIVFISWPHDIHPIGAATIGSSHIATMIALIIAGLALWLLGFIRIRVSVSMLVGVALFTILFQGKLDGGMMDQLFSGHVMLAAFFLATDATSSPINKLAGWIYGLGIGFLIVLIRAYGVWPDAIPFAVMLMNILNPLLDRIRPKVITEAV